jgi:hypothetical protein
MAAWSLRQKGGTALSEELRERTDGTGSGRLGPRLVPIPTSPCLGVSPAPRSTGTPRTTPTTSSLPVSPLSGSTAISSSPRLTPSKTGSATSSTHPAGSRGSCSTARASTSSTLRVRPRWRKSRGLLRSPGSHPQACSGEASGCGDLGPGWSAEADWARPHPRQCPPSRTGAKGCDRRQARPGADLTVGYRHPSSR